MSIDLGCQGVAGGDHRDNSLAPSRIRFAVHQHVVDAWDLADDRA